MTIVQRGLWVEVAAATVLIVGLGVWLAVQLSNAAPAEIRPGAGMTLVVVASSVVRILGRRWVRDRTLPGDDLTDERDRELGRRADALTLNVFMGLVAVPLVLGLFGAERLWLVASLFAAYLVAGLVNAVIRLDLYRRS